MVRRFISIKTRLLAAAVLLIAASGCTDLGAVREWSSTSLQATQFNQIVTTYADTPERLAIYDKDGADLWQDQAARRAAQADALNLQLALIGDYMAALGALSAGSAVDYEQDVGTLTTSLKETGQLSDETVGAAGNLVKTILGAATSYWQQKRVGELVEQANPSLQRILGSGLHDIVDRDFRRDLRIEAGILNRHFKDLLQQGGGSPTANAALTEWFVVRLAENRRRLEAVDAYLEVLDAIAGGHQALFDSRNDLDSVALVKRLFKDMKKIRKNAAIIVKS